MKNGRRLGGLVAAALWVVVVAATPAGAQYGAQADGEWPTYGGDLGNTKYSPLDQITADNFDQLEIAWRWRSADGFLSKTDAAGGELWTSSRLIFDELNREDPDRWRDGEAPYVGRFKATPLMVGGRMFVNTPTSVGGAIDARTGETLWVFNPKTYEAGTTTMTARWIQRGVAYTGPTGAPSGCCGGRATGTWCPSTPPPAGPTPPSVGTGASTSWTGCPTRGAASVTGSTR